MESRIRKQIERATRVLSFSLEHPSTRPGHAVAVGRLEQLLAQAEAAAQAQFGGRRGVRAAVVERTALRARLASDLLLLAGIARSAAAESVGTDIMIQHPGPRDGQFQFLTTGRTAVAEARKYEDLLLRYGLVPDDLDAITAGLDAFEQLVMGKEQAARSHVGAGVALSQLTKELWRVVSQLHVINRHRFRDDPASMAAWVSASDVRVGVRKRESGGGSAAA